MRLAVPLFDSPNMRSNIYVVVVKAVKISVLVTKYRY